MELQWREKWEEAYQKASFYQSFQNTAAYWDKVAVMGASGLGGDRHIQKLLEELQTRDILSVKAKVLDMGCGCGEYTAAFASRCLSVKAVDYSKEMLEKCREFCEEKELSNVLYQQAEVLKYCDDNAYDLVLACLNPGTYCPEGFEKLLKLSKGYVVYMSTDTPLESGEKEPIYRACNSVRFPVEYMRERGISYEIIPYDYQVTMPDGKTRQVPFRYLLIDVQTNRGTFLMS